MALTGTVTVSVVTVRGPAVVKVSKSRRSWHTELELLQTSILQVDPDVEEVEMSVEVKYVVFSATVEPQDFSKIQQTPNELAQVPLFVPPFDVHSAVV